MLPHPALFAQPYAGRVMLTLPAGPFDAYLFDCDGTIADSMPIHYDAWRQALGEWGGEFSEELYYAWGGRTVADIIADLNERQGLSMPVAAVAARREELYQALLPTVRAVPEVREHIVEAHGRVPFAVVSGSTRASVTASLTALDLLDRFDILVCAEDYARPKPDPECFLTAAVRLGADPARCLVFEDSDLGLQAAAAAGMPAVRIPSPAERRAAS
jgi:HAD superfamily hydrolase (TIGR01509 family)